jgi:hypothetical protein
MRNVSEKGCRKNQNKHFVYKDIFGNHFVYEKMWKNIVVAREATDDNMAPAGYLRLQTHTHTHTHTEYLLLFHTTMVARTRLNFTFYVHCLFCLRVEANESKQRNCAQIL